jgi:predicted ester cyclase
MSTQNQRNKERILSFWSEMDAAPTSEAAAIARRHLHKDFLWQGPAPFTSLHGPDAFVEQYQTPLRLAFPDFKRETHLFFGGQSQGKKDGSQDDAMWVCGTGYFTGKQMDAFIGIPACTAPLRIRWAEFYRFLGDDIVQCQMLLDFVDWFEQIGRPVLPPSRGASHVYPAPTAMDGMLVAAQDAKETEHTLHLIRDFLFAGLNKFDQTNLKSMGVARYFHKNVKWYGPGGIGACLSLKEFEDLHQRPWLIAYPDRQIQDLSSLFAEGQLTGSSGWRAVIATHTGPYLDCPATGKQIEFNGIDFWLRVGDVFTENWVFVDMVHLFAQFGIELFGRMKSSIGQGRRMIPVMAGDPR